jgi:hypothetical protein
VDERDDLKASPRDVVVFLLRVAHALCSRGAVATADDEEVVVAVIDDPLDELELLFVRCGEQLHSRRDAVQLDHSLNDGAALRLQVSVG